MARSFFFLLLLLLLAPSFAGAAQHGPTTPRERWAAKSDAERAELWRRFRQLQDLAPEERAALVERARRMAELVEEERRSLSEEERARLDALDAPERERRLRERLLARARRAGERVREHLPRPLLEELRDAPPLRRPFLLRRHLDDQRGARSRRVLEHLGRALGEPRERVRAWMELDERERSALVLRLWGELAERMVDEGERPRGVPPEAWEHLRGLRGPPLLEHARRLGLGPVLRERVRERIERREERRERWRDRRP